jgi:transposase
MRDRDLYARILGVEAPWSVIDVELDDVHQRVTVLVQHGGETACPVCGKSAPGYDTKRRQWRHLDTCQYQTYLAADVPRVNCPDHGVRQIKIPWAESNSRFTALFECLVIDWLKEASVAAVGRRLGLSWDEVDGIMARAVARGLRRRKRVAPRAVGIDETSYQKRHEYVTAVSDLDEGVVLYVGDDRTEESVRPFFEGLDASQREGIEAVAMDMWTPYMNVVEAYVPEAQKKICFDKFHVARHLGGAVDMVRKQEHRELTADDDARLKRSKYLWLQNPDTMSEERWTRFQALRTSTLRTARAWAMKEHAMLLWEYVSRGWASRAWHRWLGWASRCRLEPMVKVGRMVRQHLWGIINAVVLGATNAISESMNSKIQRIKGRACGYRNRQRFRNAILFHLGGLDLYPEPLSTHTIA